MKSASCPPIGHRTMPPTMRVRPTNGASRSLLPGPGGAAHLAGVVAGHTPLPVIGVPIKSAALSGQDSLLSIVQMPAGVPVATVAIDGARNAGLLAMQILATSNASLLERFQAFKAELVEKTRDKDRRLQERVKAGGL